MMNTCLFLCTGNYRSRYAECVFNAIVAEQRLSWQANHGGLPSKEG